MQNIVVNKNTISRERKQILYTVEPPVNNDGTLVYTFKTQEKHKLKNGERILLIKKFVDKFDENGTLIEPNFSERQQRSSYTNETKKIVPIHVISDTEFTISFSEFTYTLIEYTNNGDGTSILHVMDPSIEYIVNDNQHVIISVGDSVYQGATEKLKDDNGTWEIQVESSAPNRILFQHPLNTLADINSVFIRNTWHMKDDSDMFDDVNIELFENKFFISTIIPLSTNVEYKEIEKTEIAKQYVHDANVFSLPEIIDNEKRQFCPVIKKNGYYKMAQELVFNLHFRERDDFSIGSAFKVDDQSIWNGFTLSNDDSSLRRKYSAKSDDLADELCDIGFTEDDIKYQKTKVKKTFIRLLFYSTNSILSRELLYYSTIFLDSNVLYQKYGQIINKGLEKIFDEKRFDEKLRLSTSFSVKNKYHTNKSSEGFYLYLFPNEVQENEERTIYMKVEFNHAGYGKTIPMMAPRGGDNFGGQLSPTDDGFPLTFLTNDKNGMFGNDYEGYTNSVMIPINIKYDKSLKSYIYYFPWYYRGDDEKIIINLWEPRMRGYVNGSN